MRLRYVDRVQQFPGSSDLGHTVKVLQYEAQESFDFTNENGMPCGGIRYVWRDVPTEPEAV